MMKFKPSPRRIWVKATSSYWVSYIVSWLTVSLATVLVSGAILATILWLLSLQQKMPQLAGALKLVLTPVAVVDIGLTIWILWKVFAFFLSKVWVTKDELVRMLKTHAEWCDECDAANLAGRPEPPYPYR